MEFKSNKAAVLAALKLCKKEFCDGVGTLVVAEAQSLTPVDKSPNAPHPGNLRRSEVFEVMPNNEGVIVGVTPDAPYALAVEKGDSHHKPQPYLEPGAMNSIPKITNVAEALYRSKLGGS